MWKVRTAGEKYQKRCGEHLKALSRGKRKRAQNSCEITNNGLFRERLRKRLKEDQEVAVIKTVELLLNHDPDGQDHE